MSVLRKILIFIALISLFSCSASYEELIETNFNPKNEFSKYLWIAYKEKAEFEAKEMHDWNSAKLYSEKAIKALKGDKILPEHISYWNITSNNLENISKKRSELIKAYNNLMIIYDDAMLVDTFNLAKAISSLDCWSEQQEENWQTWDIDKCRNDYLNAMHTLYDIISENKKILNPKIDTIKKPDTKKINDGVSLVTKDTNKNIFKIIYFDFDKSKLSSVSIKKINAFIKKNKNIVNKFIVVGHTDTKGTKIYNHKLSLKRAETIKILLTELGIKSENIKILGKGEGDLRVLTDDEIAHPANRRAEISALN